MNKPIRTTDRNASDVTQASIDNANILLHSAKSGGKSVSLASHRRKEIEAEVSHLHAELARYRAVEGGDEAKAMMGLIDGMLTEFCDGPRTYLCDQEQSELDGVRHAVTGLVLRAQAKVRYQSAVSGMWYTDPDAADSIWHVEVSGRQFEVADNEVLKAKDAVVAAARVIVDSHAGDDIIPLTYAIQALDAAEKGGTEHD